jgi:hypothetical protein
MYTASKSFFWILMHYQFFWMEVLSWKRSKQQVSIRMRFHDKAKRKDEVSVPVVSQFYERLSALVYRFFAPEPTYMWLTIRLGIFMRVQKKILVKFISINSTPLFIYFLKYMDGYSWFLYKGLWQFLLLSIC